VRYLTGRKIADMLRAAARVAHPDLSENEIAKFSAHSLRVWACVILSEAGEQPDVIKSRLRWLGESYRIYLRDTNKIAEKHNAALEAATNAVLEICAPNLTQSDVTSTDSEDVGEYDGETDED